MHDICDRVRRLKVTRQDILDICQEKDRRSKLRFDSKPGQGEDIFIRVSQGQSFENIISGQSLKFIVAPSHMLHSTTATALTIIFKDGLRVMQRAAMQFVPRRFNARQENYVTSRKSPYILVIDAYRAVLDESHSFYLTMNDVILCDGDTPSSSEGRLDAKYIIALYKYERRSYVRLGLDAAIGGIAPIPEHKGTLDASLGPQLIPRLEPEIEHFRRIDTSPKRAPTKRSPTPAGHPASESPVGNIEKPTSKTSPRIKPNDRRRNPLVFSPACFVSTRDISSPPQSHQAKRVCALSSQYNTDQKTFAPGSIVEPLPNLSPSPSPGSDPFVSRSSQHDSDEDDEEVSLRESPSPKSRREACSDLPQWPITLTPTQEQWGSPTNGVLGAVNEYTRTAMPPIEDDDLPIVGHPVTWLMNRARAFDANFRSHRAPTHPTNEALQNLTPAEVRRTLSVYGERLARAVAPDEKQRRAAWRNFVTRTAKRLTEMVGKAEVRHAYLSLVLLLLAILPPL